jgi:hypothetical protein
MSNNLGSFWFANEKGETHSPITQCFWYKIKCEVDERSRDWRAAMLFIPSLSTRRGDRDMRVSHAAFSASICTDGQGKRRAIVCALLDFQSSTHIGVASSIPEDMTDHHG